MGEQVDGTTLANGEASTRRRVVRVLAAGLGAVVGARSAGQTAARRKKKRPARCIARPAQTSCNASAECCPGSTSRVCSQNYCGEGIDPVCCGGVGASCEAHCDCCGELVCGIHGKCVY